MLLLSVHLWFVLKKGISVPPVPGELVDPATYDAKYEEELRRGEPFLGEAMIKDIVFSALVVIVVVVIAALAGPKGPSDAARSDIERRESAAGLAVPVAIWIAVA